MSKTIVDGREVFDGSFIDLYESRCSGGFGISSVDGLELERGDLVTFVVTARLSDSKLSEKKGVVKRSNTFKVQSGYVLPVELAIETYESLGVMVDGVNVGLVDEGLEDETEEQVLVEGEEVGTDVPLSLEEQELIIHMFDPLEDSWSDILDRERELVGV